MTLDEFVEEYNGAPLTLDEFAEAATEIDGDGDLCLDEEPPIWVLAEEYLRVRYAFMSALEDIGVEMG